jgi:glycine/D-amino acid oxidase-like deaminating enzyme
VDFFPTAQMRLAFLKRYEEDPSYLQLPPDEHNWDQLFHYELGYGVITPCYLVDLPALLSASRKRMLEQGVLREELFDREELKVDGGMKPDRSSGHEDEVGAEGTVRYRDIHAGQVIFCDGIESSSNSYFSRLPFAPNKGEALIVEIPELDALRGNFRGRTGPVFKKGMSLAPWKEGLYWVGSSYEWTFDHGEPTTAFRKKTEAVLQEWLKVPFHIVEHIASVRPATLERRPFVGFHPLYPAVGILNGMGTKGCSLAPYFAHQLVQSITKGTSIRPDADIRRFSGILSRK